MKPVGKPSRGPKRMLKTQRTLPKRVRRMMKEISRSKPVSASDARNIINERGDLKTEEKRLGRHKSREVGMEAIVLPGAEKAMYERIARGYPHTEKLARALDELLEDRRAFHEFNYTRNRYVERGLRKSAIEQKMKMVRDAKRHAEVVKKAKKN